MINVSVAATITMSFASAALAQSAQCSAAFKSWGSSVGSTIPAAGDCTSLAAGQDFLVILKLDGSIQSFGNIGAAPAGNYIAVAGGFGHAAAITTSRRTVAWGLNHNGQTSVPAGLPDAMRVTTTYNNTAIIDVAGQIHVWGWAAQGLNSAPSGIYKEIDGGEYHFAALRSDGAVQCWGFNDAGQATVPQDLGTCLGVAAGGGIVGYVATGHSIAITADGRIRCWGNNGWGQCAVPATAQSALAVSAGGLHSLALMDDGSVMAWGFNGAGQITVPSGLANIGQITAGEQGSFAVETCCVGDILRDSLINGADLGAMLSYWGPVSTSPVSRACDLNGDSVVNGADIGLLLSNWGSCL
jgi:alpha-tubulin suppressor-like RCC1 family protein